MTINLTPAVVFFILGMIQAAILMDDIYQRKNQPKQSINHTVLGDDEETTWLDDLDTSPKASSKLSSSKG